MNQQIVLGPPGTGKTTYLLSQVEEALAQGVPGFKVGYFAFTKKAAEEAITRAVRKFKLNYRDLPYFRTLHSLAFHQIGMTNGQVMGRDHFKELGRHLGLNISAYISMEEGQVAGGTPDDRLVFIENLARVRCVDLATTWHDQGEDLHWSELDRYRRGLNEFKRVRGLLDYTDMVSQFIARGKGPTLDLLVIDEAQDLSELQWRMVDILCQNSKRILIAGDDDQCIYRWAGASVDRFLNLKGDIKVLDRSYRIPAEVHSFANRISSRIESRRKKDFKPRPEKGAVLYHPNLESVDLSSGQWLILARNRYLLIEAQELCETNGYNYMATGMRAVEPELSQAIHGWSRALANGGLHIHQDERELFEKYARKKDVDPLILMSTSWEQAFTKITPARKERIAAMMRRGEDITKEPRIKLSTIHGAKGGEADNVLVLTDVSYRSYQEMQKNPDDELRVLYVAVTRAKERLHLVEPQTNCHFKFE